MDFISVPCFLEDASRPLIRAGQQLQVLVKLLKLCNYGIFGYNNYGRENDPKDLPNLEDVLPCWEGVSSDSAFLLNPMMFCRKDLGDLVEKRNTMYQMMLDKLHHFFTKLDVKYHQLGYTVSFILLLEHVVFHRFWCYVSYSIYCYAWFLTVPFGFSTLAASVRKTNNLE